MGNDELMVTSATGILGALDEGLFEELENYRANLTGKSKVVMDKYEVSFLGEGDSAYVLKITDIHLGTIFAMKIGYWLSRQNVYTYVADGWIGEALSDLPEIVRVYGYDERFCLMEYINGDLGGDLPDAELVEMDYLGKMDRLIREVYSYGYGVYDLHLDNVLVDISNNFRVIDVGGYHVLSESPISLEQVLENFEKDTEQLRNHRDFGEKWYTQWD